MVRTINRVVLPFEPTARRFLAPLNEDWKEASRRAGSAAADLGVSLEKQIIRAILNPLDLTRLVSERIDLNALVDEIDLERVVAHVDPDEIAARVDIDRIAARLNLDAVIARIDIGTLVREVLDEIDLPDLIRESTGTLAADAVEEVRYVSVSGDRMIARAIDRVVGRRRRHLDAPGEPSSLSPPRRDERS